MYFSLLRPFLNHGKFLLPQRNKIIPFVLPKPPFTHKTHSPKPTLILKKQNYPFISSKHFVSYFSAESFLKMIFQHDNSLRRKMERKITSVQYEGNEEIEDKIAVEQLNSIDGVLVSIFDGHGGGCLAEYASSNIASFIESEIQKCKRMEEYIFDDKRLITHCLKKAFDDLENNFYEDVYKEQMRLNNRKAKHVGSCALTVLLYKNHIYVANSGDSQAIVVGTVESQIQFFKLNSKLSVNNPKQRKRLKEQFPNQENIVVEDYEGCYYLKGRLQPTKTIGDYYLKKKQDWKGPGQFRGPYLTHKPEISVYEIEESFRYIFVASDGVWDFLSKKRISQLIFEENREQAILNELIQRVGQFHGLSEEEVRNLDKTDKRNYHDDISFSIIDLSETIGNQ